MNRTRGGVPIPDHARVTRVSDPALRGYVPLLAAPSQNANQTVSKVAATLNRAGSSPSNPILSGLGGHFEFRIDDRDRLQSVFFYQDRRQMGDDLIDSVVALGSGIFGVDVRYGDGRVQAGDPVTGAVQNFIRVVTKAGAAERSFWVKSYDQDVIDVNDQNALDAALNPVEILCEIVDDSRDWFDCVISFMDSWADEFQVAHNRNATDRERGNLKPYGGAKFVSFFQTGDDEGQGVEVNAVTQQAISDAHTLQVQNTVGLKHVTVRFRSKQGSAFFVDVPILIRLVEPPEQHCTMPLAERCGEELLLRTTPTPDGLQSTPSVPGVQDEAGLTGAPISQDLFYLAVHGNAAGASPTVMVYRYAAVPSAEDLSGFIWQLISALEYKPLSKPAATPAASPPYLGPNQLTLCFSRTIERLAGVGLYMLAVKDGDDFSPPIPFPGPSARDIAVFPTGGTGGVDACFYG